MKIDLRTASTSLLHLNTRTARSFLFLLEEINQKIRTTQLLSCSYWSRDRTTVKSIDWPLANADDRMMQSARIMRTNVHILIQIFCCCISCIIHRSVPLIAILWTRKFKFQHLLLAFALYYSLNELDETTKRNKYKTIFLTISLSDYVAYKMGN